MRLIQGNPETRDLLKVIPVLKCLFIKYIEYTFRILVAFYMSNKIQMHGINCFLI